MSSIEYYDSSGTPATGSQASSSAMRAEFDLVQAGFGKLPDLSGNAGKAAVVNGGGTGLTVTVGNLLLDVTLWATGGGTIVLNSTGPTNITLPQNGTLATLAGAETLTNKFINLSNNTLAFTSAQLALQCSDETGSGALVFASAPVLSNPTVGTQSQGDNSTKAASTAYVDTAVSSKQTSDATLTALAGLDSSLGFVVEIAADTFVKRTLVAPAAGLSITHQAGTANNPTFALANDLAALEGLGSTGIAVRTAADTWAQRTLTGTANEITVTNGDGVSGNPTASLPSALTLTSKTITSNSAVGMAAVAGDNDPNKSPRASELGGLAFQSPEAVVISPQPSVTPVGVGDMVFQLTSDTTLVVKVRGSDGTVRSSTLTLA